MSRDPEDGRRKIAPTGDYPVGYCRPPEETRFKSGRPSANPKGRPRGRKDDVTILREMLEQKVEVSLPGGKKKKMPIWQVAALKQVVKAASGDSRAWSEVKAIAERVGITGPARQAVTEDELTPGEEASLDDFFARYAEEKGIEIAPQKPTAPPAPTSPSFGSPTPVSPTPVNPPTVRPIVFPARAGSGQKNKSGRAR